MHSELVNDVVDLKGSNEMRNQFQEVHLQGKVLCREPDLLALMIGRG